MSNNRGLEPAPKKRIAKGPAFPGEPGNPGSGKPGPGGPELPKETSGKNKWSV